MSDKPFMIPLLAGALALMPQAAQGEFSPSTYHQLMEKHEAGAYPEGSWIPQWQPDAAVLKTFQRGQNGRSQGVSAEGLQVGAGVRSITPTKYEIYTDANGDATYQPDVDSFEDTGVDQLWDYQEPGALGPDGQPGRANFDDDDDGYIDEPDEYGEVGSDDVLDPNGDNYHRQNNPSGTENNATFDAVALAGFGGTFGVDIRPATGVHDDIYSRSLLMSQGGEEAIIIVNDVIGLLFQYMNPVKRAVSEATGIPFDNIVISSTHTHQGPDTIGIWGGPVDEEYMSFVMDQMYESALEAWASQQPVSVRSTTAKTRACYDKDSLVMRLKDDCVMSDYFLDNLQSVEPYDQYIVQNDTRDPWVRRFDIPVQQFVSEGGDTVATMISFDTHPEILLDENTLISSDYPHFTREYLENALGGTAIFMSGTVGSQIGALRGAPIPLYDVAGQPVYQAGVFDAEGNAFPAWASGFEDRTRSQGYEIGRWAVEALSLAELNGDAQLALASEVIDVRINNPIFRGIIQFVAAQENFEEQQYIIKAPYCTKIGCVRTAMHRITIGDATYMTVPGEFPPEYIVGREESTAPYSDATGGEYEDWYFPAMPTLLDAVPTSEFFMIGLANNYFGYAMAEADHTGIENSDHPNWYEEVYTTDVCFGDMIGNKLFEMLGSAQSFNRSCLVHP